MKHLISALFLTLVVRSQDPAQGWLGYAKGVNPDGSDTPVTYIEATWEIPHKIFFLSKILFRIHPNFQ